MKLAELRRSRGLSQEALALQVGISQRHLSFLETGRAQPGQASLRKLTQGLALRNWEQRALLDTLSGHHSSPNSKAEDKSLGLSILERLSHWPAYAFLPDGSLVAQNDAMRILLAEADPGNDLWEATAPPAGPNIYDLVFHPAGLQRFLSNPEVVIPETMRRLRIEAASDPSLGATVDRLGKHSSVRQFDDLGSEPGPALIERYDLKGEELAIVSVLSHLASPGEPELDSLRIESFVPANEQSEALIRKVIAA